MKHQVLIYGHDPLLLRTRELLLRQAGLEVWVSDVGEEIHQILSARPIDLLILCHTVDCDERAATLAAMRASQKNPAILFLTADYRNPFVPEDASVFSTLDGPYGLLQTVCRLTHEPAPAPYASNQSNSGQVLCHDLQAR